jgi:hypothetical protein
MGDHTKNLKIHYRPFNKHYSIEIACMGNFFPVKTTTNLSKVTCKNCLKAKWYKRIDF